MTRILSSLLFFVTVIALGCGQASRPPVRVAAAANHDSAVQVNATAAHNSTSQSTAMLVLDSTGAADLGSAERAGEEGWQSEAFSAAADLQLKTLAKMLEHGPPWPISDVTPLVSEDSQFGRLRPSRLDVVFQDLAFVVRRSAEREGGAGSGDPRTALGDPRTAQFRGADGLARALDGLVAPLSAAADRRAKFKIYRVDMSSDQPLTLVHFQLSGHTAEGMLQQTAVWTCRWAPWSPHEAPTLRAIEISDYEEVTGRRAEGTLFTDCTEAVLGHNASYREQLAYGLDYWLDRLEFVYGIAATSYQGLAVGDVNGDGLDDLYVCQPGGILGGLPNRLFLQQPDGTARDISAESGVDWLIETHSALVADLDNDGDQDLVAATVAGLLIAANDGEGRFHTAAVKLIPEAPPMSLAAADYDNDGDLDIYACCYSRRATSELLGRPIPYHDANNGGRNVLFRNDRDWRFTNVTREVGLDQNNRRFSLACAWEDFDNDGDMDLYVANDFGRNNLYRNDGGHFIDIAAEAGVEDISAGMSVSWGDYNNDGWMDLYVSNMWSSAGNRVAYQRRFLGDQADATTLAEFQRHARGNSLFANLGRTGEVAFEDVSVAAQVTMGRWAWTSRFVDINNDSREDLMVANGYITQEDPDDL